MKKLLIFLTLCVSFLKATCPSDGPKIQKPIQPIVEEIDAIDEDKLLEEEIIEEPETAAPMKLEQVTADDMDTVDEDIEMTMEEDKD